MLFRKSHWGLALLTAGSLTVTASAPAQDANSSVVPPPVPTAEPAAPQRLPTPNKLKLQDDIEQRVLERNRKRYVTPDVHDADPWKKHPPVWSIRDDSKTVHPYSKPSTPAPGIGHYPGGPTGQWGIPYYYTATSPDTAYSGLGPTGAINGIGVPAVDDDVHFHGAPTEGVIPQVYGPAPAGPTGAYPPAVGTPDNGVPAPVGQGPGYGASAYGDPGYGPAAGPSPYGQQRAAVPGQLPGNPYLYHFGPGYYRNNEAGHYRFPYYSYRRPWYFLGHPSYNRDTNVPW